MFADLAIPPRNRRVLTWFLVVTLGVPLFLTAVLFLGVWAGWWGFGVFWVLTLFLVFIRPLILWMNWQIASLRHQCECGRPGYKFMGLLGRSYAYRCSTCGKLLRLRD